MNIAEPGPRPQVLAALLLCSLACGPGGARAEDVDAFAVDVQALPIQNFRIGSHESRFGPLEFIGGFELRSEDRRFGQISSIRFLTPGTRLIGVADHGYWLHGTIERDAHGRPVGMADVSMQPIIGEDGPLHLDKHYGDAEGLSVHEGVATVAFERDHRVLEFEIGRATIAQPTGEVQFLIPRQELRYNRGIETVARAPDDSPLGGARIVVSERSLDPEGNLFAAILEGPERGGFFIARSDGFDVTDGVFLPDGDLLLLERRFPWFFGGAIRLRRVAAADLRAGVLVDGEILLEADMTYQIDNMEALEAWQTPEGATVLSLMSDDNQSFLQRTLYLEFRLVEE